MSPSPDLRFTLSTASLFPLPLATTFRLAQEADFAGLELAVTPEVMQRGAGYVAELSRRHGVPLLSLHEPLFPWPGWRDPKERHVRSLALAQALEIPMITFHPPTTETRHDLSQVRQDPLRAFGLHGPQPGPTVSWENLPPRVAHGSPMRFILQGEFPVTFDFCHAGVSGGDALDLYQRLRERIVHVHLSDVKARKIPRVLALWRMLYAYLQTNLVEHQLPGQGVLPIIPFLRHLRDDGYSGTVALEISPVALGVWNPRRLVTKLRRALDYCRQA